MGLLWAGLRQCRRSTRSALGLVLCLSSTWLPPAHLWLEGLGCVEHALRIRHEPRIEPATRKAAWEILQFRRCVLVRT